MTQPRTRWFASACAALALVAGGCSGIDAASSAPIQTRAQALNGTITWNATYACDASAQATIQAAMDILVGQVRTDPGPLHDCLADAILSPDNGGFAERIMSELATNIPTEVRCEDSGVVSCYGTYGWAACAAIGISGEIISLDRGHVASHTPADIAGLMAHEILHNHGYDHMPGVEYGFSVNSQALVCSQSLSATGVASPWWIRRSTMTGEAELQQIGGDDGIVFDQFCPPGYLMSGATFPTTVGPRIGGTTTINGLSTTCRSMTSSATLSLAMVGGTGIAATRSCAADEVVVGIGARASATVERLSLVCERLTDVQARLTTPTVSLLSVGGTLLTPFNNIERRCPAGMAVRAVLGRANISLNQMRLVCQDVAAVPNGTPHDAALGGTGLGLSATTREHCSDNGALIGVYGRVGASGDITIERLGGGCLGLARTAGALAAGSLFSFHPTPANGRTSEADNTLFDARCSNQFVVGIRTGTDPVTGALSYIGVNCATAGSWDAPTLPVGITFGPGVGVDNGGLVTTTCPLGEFVSGLEVRATVLSGRRRVDRVMPICRRFG
jgi:hypothetical protein